MFIANAFNDFFSSNFTDTSDDNISDTWCSGHIGSPQLSSISTSANEIFNLIHSLKLGKAPGPDGITSTMLKHTAAEIATPFFLVV